MEVLEVRDEVVLRVSARSRLEEVEREVIDPADLDEDEKAALWLLAWCHSSKHRVGGSNT